MDLHSDNNHVRISVAAKPPEDGLEAQLREVCHAAVKRHMHEEGRGDCLDYQAEFAAFVRTHQAARTEGTAKFMLIILRRRIQRRDCGTGAEIAVIR